MSKSPLIVFWSRRDFRLFDNPALFQACKLAKEKKLPFLPLFILDEKIISLEENSHPNIGFPRRLFLSKVLSQFALKFPTFPIFKANPEQVFEALSQHFELHLFVNEDVEPYSISRDQNVQKIVEKSGGTFALFSDQISVDKNILTSSGNFYSIFTPFKNAVWEQFLDAKVYPQADLSQVEFLSSEKMEDLFGNLPENLQPILAQKEISTENLQQKLFTLLDKPWRFQVQKHLASEDNEKGKEKVAAQENKTSKEFILFDLDQIFERPNLDNWYSSEEEAQSHFDFFLDKKILDYKDNRDSLGLDTLEEKSAAKKLSGNQKNYFYQVGQTSRISVALKWGLVSARFLKEKILQKYGNPRLPLTGEITPEGQKSLEHYLSELIWREFYRYILFRQPQVLDLEFLPKFQEKINWVEDELAQKRFLAWIRGETGYPIVDAAMRQVSQEGWMHNRSRMIVASVLSKNLGVDWRWGQEYFRAALLDLDEASNNGGWQWAASTGADPKPIRIFNPYLQAENHDKEGLYQKKWLHSDFFPKAKKGLFIKAKSKANSEKNDVQADSIFAQEEEDFREANLVSEPIVDHKKAREEALKRYGLGGQKAVRDF